MGAKKKAKTTKKKTRPVASAKGRSAYGGKKKVVKKRAGTKAKAAPKKVVAKPATVVSPPLQIVGEVTHFFPHVSAGVIKLSNDLKVGDMIQIKGHTTDFKETVDSMQINHVPVNEAKKGQEIGIKVKDKVRIGDVVYKL